MLNVQGNAELIESGDSLYLADVQKINEPVERTSVE
tara:strand:+ start:2160 stop:2267 length:108 start_codon:yes stop_codon:yes gene_type:complete